MTCARWTTVAFMSLAIALPIAAQDDAIQDGAARGDTTQEVAAEPRVTLVRVVDENGERVDGARVYSQAFDRYRQPSANEASVVTCNDRGHARLLATGPLVTWIWAVVDRDGKRLASTAKCLSDIGRPQTLVVRPYEVAKVRILNANAWLDVLPEDTSLRCAFVSNDEPHVRFDVPIPRVRGSSAPDRGEAKPDTGCVLELPPLPHGNYNPALVDDRGVLDARYYSPAFQAGNPSVEELYERDVPLKRIFFGDPVEVRVRARPRGSDPDECVAKARVLARANYSGFDHLREWDTDDTGTTRIFLPRHTRGLGWQGMELHVLAAGFRPFRLPLTAFPEQTDIAVELDRGVETKWTFRNTRPGDRVYVRTTPTPIGAFEQIVYEFGIDDRFPSFDDGIADKTSLFVEREGVLWPIAIGSPADTLDVDLDSHFVETVIEARYDKRAVPHARVEVVLGDRGMHDQSLSYVADATGRCRLRLPRGDIMLFAADPLHGAILRSARVTEPGVLTLELEPYATFRGVVRLHDAGVRATLQIQSDFRSIDPSILDRWVRVVPQRWRTDDNGSFRIMLPAFVPRWSLSAIFESQNSYHHASSMLETRDAASPIELLLNS
ncbi:MAG: hypothetical protein H6834_00680 [Planctomycetes bacterium]|nr:hypothetical protein [Planctomycetota bacterium]